MLPASVVRWFMWILSQSLFIMVGPEGTDVSDDIASGIIGILSGVLHFVWPLSKSLSSMVEPSRSQELQLA